MKRHSKGTSQINFYLNLGLLAVFTLGGAWISVKSALDGQKNRAIARKIA